MTTLPQDKIDQLQVGVAVYESEGAWYWQRIPHWPHNHILCGDPVGPYLTDLAAWEAAPKEDA